MAVMGDCLPLLGQWRLPAYLHFPFHRPASGRFQGFQLDGSGTADGVGIHLGEIEGATWQDLDIQNFNGAHGVGLWLDNAHANGKVGTWTEAHSLPFMSRTRQR